jgi:hypothetical protein
MQALQAMMHRPKPGAQWAGAQSLVGRRRAAMPDRADGRMRLV